MKKIIAAVLLISFSTFSANAAPSLGMFSLTGGLAANNSVWGASGKQEQFELDGTAQAVQNQSGVFTESFSSQFIEVGVGQWVSLGYEVSDNISTPTNVTQERDVAPNGGTFLKNEISVTFQDLTTTYLKVNTPIGVYFKFGSVETDLDIKEVMSSGANYANVSTSGSSTGMGYQKHIGESGFGFRFEANYIELDGVKTDNGNTNGSLTCLNTGTCAGVNNGLNKVSASNLEGLTGKVALTYTLGRN
tara:strand:- start:1038 stop:1778 length:741 start_codon:yes stop_codon:yes gene_type:complete